MYIRSFVYFHLALKHKFFNGAFVVQIFQGFIFTIKDTDSM